MKHPITAKHLFAYLLMAVAGAAVCWAILTTRPQEVKLVTPKKGELVVINGCVISAFDYLAAVEARHKLEPNFWARVMLVRYANYSSGHAYCVWESDGRIYGYDRSSGGFPIPGQSKDAVSIAQSLSTGISQVVHKDLIVKSAEFLEPDTTKVYTF
ncbi:MAG: hypothetical protein QM796_15850 [Chthoniobacteraceae bacterium]